MTSDSAMHAIVIPYLVEAVAFLLGAFQAPCLAQEEPKPILSSLDELPSRTYTLPGTVDELIASPALLIRFSKTCLS